VSRAKDCLKGIYYPDLRLFSLIGIILVGLIKNTPARLLAYFLALIENLRLLEGDLF
jgi:hypothetical protein